MVPGKLVYTDTSMTDRQGEKQSLPEISIDSAEGVWDHLREST